MKQNWHSTFSPFDISSLFLTTWLHGLLGKWKEQGLQDEGTNNSQAPESPVLISPSPEPRGGTSHPLVFPMRGQRLTGMNNLPRILLGRDVDAGSELWAFPLSPLLF